MSLSMYQASIPVFDRALNNLAVVLGKGAAHAKSRAIDPAVLLDMRLAPDMFPLLRNVQIVTDLVKACPARLAGLEPPSWADEESTFEQLDARIHRAVDYLAEYSPQQIDGTEDRTVNLKIRGEPMTLTGQNYLLHFVLPNVFFHATTSYAILRHAGVELGKRDFLGPM
jgi:hypothetical protein